MLLRDPVHGLVTFEREEESIVVRLLETREVQRLRRIRQLGLTHLAYPGADHTRFAHAIGSAHVMTLFIARLRMIHDELPFWQRLTSERARDAIAAAFLHDLGHGPYSHLFEGALARATGVVHHHEDWTKAIVLDSSSEVNKVLVETDPELPGRVVSLIEGRHPLAYLANTVSGTFDVDRCDYLLRDAHCTGVRYGEYDLPWLLRSLRLGVGDEEHAPGLAIDGAKGLSAIESFLLARLFMFQQVYFHKSTRAAEWMLSSILARAVLNLANGDSLAGTPDALYDFARGQKPSISDYVDLDDVRLAEAMRHWEGAGDPILADLCARLRKRQLFKTIELYGELNRPEKRQHALETARELATEYGLDPDLYVGLDIASDTPYADDRSLSVIFEHGRPRRPAEVSFVLDRLKDETLSRCRLIVAPEIRDAVKRALPL